MQKDLAEIIEIESVCGAAEQNAPFGKNVRKALDWFLSKAKSLGFKENENQGYCGWADYNFSDCDNNDPKTGLIGILCHLDVVPAGEGWVTPPFKLTEVDGVLYGRGVADDKAPLIAAMHALKRIEQDKVPLKRGVRIIVGCNEENGSSCIKHYVKHERIPDFSFVPDSDFPVINSEKGILHVKITLPTDKFLKENIASINCGSRPNVVPDLCTALIKKDSPLYKKIFSEFSDDLSGLFHAYPYVNNILGDGHELSQFAIINTDKGIKIEARGTAGHAMCPEKADSAFFKLMSALSAAAESICGNSAESICGNSADCACVNAVYEKFCSLYSASKLNIFCEDENSGDLTINVGIANLSDVLSLTLDLRLPLCADKDKVVSEILRHMPSGAKAEILHYAHNLFVPKDNPLVKTLLNVYNKVMNDKGDVVKSGGGTYARELPNAVAFGPTFPNITTNIHNADENYSVENFFKLEKIYYAAIIELCNM